jgi:hypothetical protein
MVKAQPSKQPCIEDLPYVDFDEVILALMWDKKRGEDKYDQRNDVSWHDPYIVNKKFKKGKYYLYVMDERKIPLSVDGSLLRPYVKGT